MVQQVANMDEFKKTVATPGKTVFVDFHAKWCKPCKQIAPEFEKLSTLHTNCIFIKVDVDEVEQAAEENEVQSLPTFLVFKDGKKVDSMVGADAENLTKFVEKNKA